MQTRHKHLEALRVVGCGHRRVFALEVGVHTAGTTHVEFTFGLGVQVDQNLALHKTFLQTEGAGHTRLFVDGDEDLHRTVLNARSGYAGEGGAYADAVVGTQRGPVGTHPTLVDDGLDGLCEEVELGIVGLRHHIGMTLQDNRDAVLHTLRGGDGEQQIAGLVLLDFDLVLGGPFLHPFNGLLFVFGRMRCIAKVCEVFPQIVGIEFQKIFVHFFIGFKFYIDLKLIVAKIRYFLRVWAICLHFC